MNLFKTNMSKGMLGVNLLTFLFFLPIFAVVFAVEIVGIEAISRYFLGSGEYYLLSNFGVGLSAGDTIASAKADIINAYRVLVYIASACLPLGFVGLAGMYNFTSKLINDVPFVTKLNKFGGQSPRPYREFFSGIAKNWWKYLIVGVVVAGIFIGCVTLIFDFAAAIVYGAASAGAYVGLVFACIILFVLVMVLALYLPWLTMYGNMLLSLKNSVLYAVQFFVPTLFMLIFAAAPLLLCLIGGPITFLLVVLFMFFGFAYECLIFTTYSQMYSEKMITPLYNELVLNKQKQQKKNVKQNSGYVNPKKRKK